MKREAALFGRRGSNRRAVLGSILFFSVSLFVLLWSTLPPINWLKYRNPKTTALMEYREKAAAARNRKIPRRLNWVPLGKISPHLVKAVVMAEDDKFFEHDGLDWEAIKKALESNLKRKKLAFGGSTITQQLAKNIFLSPRKTLLRKIREGLLAYQIDKELTKKRILELYLNVAEWGSGLYGAEAASLAYFNKHASELTPAEAIRLASVLPSPRKNAPQDNSRRWINKKREDLLARFLKRGWVDEAGFAQARFDLGFSSGPVAGPSPALPQETGGGSIREENQQEDHDEDY